LKDPELLVAFLMGILQAWLLLARGFVFGLFLAFRWRKFPSHDMMFVPVKVAKDSLRVHSLEER